VIPISFAGDARKTHALALVLLSSAWNTLGTFRHVIGSVFSKHTCIAVLAAETELASTTALTCCTARIGLKTNRTQCACVFGSNFIGVSSFIAIGALGLTDLMLCLAWHAG